MSDKMEFKIEKKHFEKAVLTVNRAVVSKGVIPILFGIKINVLNNGIELIGSNSDFMVRIFLSCINGSKKNLEIISEGSIVVNARYLSEIIKKMPDKIHFKANQSNNHVSIVSDEIYTYLNGEDSSNFPNFPVNEESNGLKVMFKDLIEIITQTSFAVSRNHNRPVLTGVNMSFDNGRISCVATDSHRLANKTYAVKSTINPDTCVIPSASVNEIIRLNNYSTETATVNIRILKNYAIFTIDNITLYSRLIDGVYPKVSNLIPNESLTELTLNRRNLLNGIDRAILFGEGNSFQIRLELIDNNIKISTNSTEVGRIEETQKVILCKGQGFKGVSLNGKYLIEALRVIKEDEVVLSYSGTFKPIVIRPKGDESLVHLISQVKSQE